MSGLADVQSDNVTMGMGFVLDDKLCKLKID